MFYFPREDRQDEPTARPGTLEIWKFTNITEILGFYHSYTVRSLRTVSGKISEKRTGVY